MEFFKLIEINNGIVNTHCLGTFEDIKKYLIENDMFSWIKDNEENEVTPDFVNVDSIEEIKTIFKKYDYSWWEMRIESEI